MAKRRGFRERRLRKLRAWRDEVMWLEANRENVGRAFREGHLNERELGNWVDDYIALVQNPPGSPPPTARERKQLFSETDREPGRLKRMDAIEDPGVQQAAAKIRDLHPVQRAKFWERAPVVFREQYLARLEQQGIPITPAILARLDEAIAKALGSGHGESST